LCEKEQLKLSSRNTLPQKDLKQSLGGRSSPVGGEFFVMDQGWNRVELEQAISVASTSG
jgi:hypothetical protein